MNVCSGALSLAASPLQGILVKPCGQNGKNGHDKSQVIATLADLKNMNLVRDFLETSTIHGLNYISSSKSVAAKAVWVTIITVSFGTAIFMINNAYTEWEESPIATTIKTQPISELVFPSVTVCPPRGSNTALNLALERVRNENFTEEQRRYLLDFTAKTFLFKPNQKQASQLVELVSPSNLMGMYEGQISLPEVEGEYTFAIRSSQPKGSFATPEYGIGNYSSGFYSKFHHHHYTLDLHNIVSLVGTGSLVIRIETQDETEEWSFSRQEHKVLLHKQHLNFSEASIFCEGLGGHLASVRSEVEQNLVMDQAQLSQDTYVLLGGSDQEKEGTWRWTDGHLWNYTNWERSPSGKWGRNTDCLFMNKHTGKWADLSCSKGSSFLCNVELTRVHGHDTIVINSTVMSSGTFNLWWTNNPQVNKSRSPGVRFSWHPKEPNMHGDMRASATGLPGQISTPGFGTQIHLDHMKISQAHFASVGLPTNITEMIGNGFLVVDIDVEIPETGPSGKGGIHARAQRLCFQYSSSWIVFINWYLVGIFINLINQSHIS